MDLDQIAAALYELLDLDRSERAIVQVETKSPAGGGAYACVHLVNGDATVTVRTKQSAVIGVA